MNEIGANWMESAVDVNTLWQPDFSPKTYWEKSTKSRIQTLCASRTVWCSRHCLMVPPSPLNVFYYFVVVKYTRIRCRWRNVCGRRIISGDNDAKWSWVHLICIKQMCGIACVVDTLSHGKRSMIRKKWVDNNGGPFVRSPPIRTHNNKNIYCLIIIWIIELASWRQCVFSCNRRLVRPSSFSSSPSSAATI